jgi:two-component system OmpR family response regulator
MEKLRVLFVDDEEELVSAVVERLQLRGMEAQGANCGDEALTLVEQHTFDVAVLDVRMQGLGGLEVLRRLKQVTPRPAVVLLSGHGSTDDVEEGLRLGAFEYLQKPVDIEHLVETIHAANRSVRGEQ